MAADNTALVDRRQERGTIDKLLTDVLAGRSRVTVLRGDAGVGKTALLSYLSDRATECVVVRAVGVESEMELAYSGLHQLCGPLLGHLDRLHPPQRDALATVFGRLSATPPDRFMVGVATLSLFAEFSEDRPLVCIVDDAQWLDQVSLQVLGFVSRRLVAERIGVVCAARTGIGDDILDDLPDWRIDGLSDSDARMLLLKSVRGPLDGAVCAQIIAECRGNPLALLELPRTWSNLEVAGGFGLPSNEQVATKVRHSYERRISELPADTQLVLVAAAAEPLGDQSLLQRGLSILGLGLSSAGPAIDAGLISIDGRVRFAHPMVRSTVYHLAAAKARHDVHRALAEATDPVIDPDRRAWHRARATLGPDEEVAAELERSAGRAQARGGFAAAAAFLQRTVALTPDPRRRAGRALAAAEASLLAGAFDQALSQLTIAEAESLDEHQQALADRLRAHVTFNGKLGRDAPHQLLLAAKRLEPFDLELARETYVTAWFAASFAGRNSRDDQQLISRALLELPTGPGPQSCLDLMMEGVSLLVLQGHAAAAPVLRLARKAAIDLPAEEVLRWGSHATTSSDATWDNDGTYEIAGRCCEIIRGAGALAHLLFPLTALANATARYGDFVGAALHIAEAEAIAAATGTRFAPYAAVRLMALQGDEAGTLALVTGMLERAETDGQGLAGEVAHWATAILYNGLGRYREALQLGRWLHDELGAPQVAGWSQPEIIEAAIRSDNARLAHEAFARLVDTTQPCATDWALGVEARCRGLLGLGRPDECFGEANLLLGRARMLPDLARSHLLYGEWLRREGRRTDAREQLRLAYDLFVEIGMNGFADRAGRELAATGSKVRRRRDETRASLTAQEEQIARLARDGMTNAAIGSTLFLSPRTVEWHLRNVFNKLGITSRSGLHEAMPRGAAEVGR